MLCFLRCLFLFCWGGEKGEDNKNQCFLFAWRPRRKKKRGACDWPGKLPSPSPLPPSVLTVFLLNGGVFLFLLSFAAATEPAKSIKTVSLRLHHGAGKTTRSARNITQTHRADLKKVWCLCLCVCVCDFVCLCVFVYLAFCLFLCVCAFACLNSPSATLLLILLFPCLSASPPNRLPPPVSPLSSLPRGASPRFVHCSLSLSLSFSYLVLPCSSSGSLNCYLMPHPFRLSPSSLVCLCVFLASHQTKKTQKRRQSHKVRKARF